MAVAYIQRVLMLVNNSAYDQVKPVWISNIVETQNADGSRGDLHPVMNLDNDYVFARTSTWPKIQKPKANFHTTAQAIWLLSMLLNQAENN